MDELINDYVERANESEKKPIPRKVSKSNLCWKPKHVAPGKYDFDVIKKRIEAKAEAGDTIAVKTIKKNIKQLVRDNPHYEDFSQLLDL